MRLAGRLAVLALLAGCARGPAPGPEAVALAYSRALYAMDAGAQYRLIAAEDRRARDEATFRRQQERLGEFAAAVLRQLGEYVTATPVRAEVEGARATVTLRLRLPDANAAPIARLLHEWDDQRLARLPTAQRVRIRERLEALHRAGTLPVVEGEETFTLVRDAAGWRVRVGWAAGVRVRVVAAVAAGLPLEVSATPAEIRVAPGERFRVTLRARNAGTRALTSRVAHRTGPADRTDFLPLLACPLLTPKTLAPGETEEFVSEYLLLKDVPAGVREFVLTYEFLPGAATARR